ncbi:MAG: alpha/beta hydrolase [Chloroflexi bacterium]|uniref:Alpha/beta hydrolase n=1 Tax=Candidatus Chlorohelix allophototropha TaxID=3003348 RepID=A0A8T7LRC7_9CHLR|nr:alpha/beta hydrolase [Chloroflexota bacterium]WJW66474.1 alpha/beta hydrolase [Chloroflexota bacterium L227-S17]
MKIQTSVKQKRAFYKTKRFKISLTGLVLGVIAIYIGICAYAASVFTTSATRDLGPNTPTTFGMPYEEITFKTSDSAQLTIRGWWIPRQNSQKTLIMVHSKDGTRTFLLPVSQRLWQQGFNILLFDTRGQGLSDGERYTFGWKEKYDVVGAVEFLKSKGFSPNHIGVVGWSMGAATALMAMAETPDIKAGLIESSYGSLDRVINEKYYPDSGMPILLYPGIKLMAKLMYDLDVDQSNPEVAITKLGERKVFLIHAEKDQEIPVSEFQILLKSGGANVAESWLVPGSKHVRSFQDYPDEYARRAVAFFNRELL